MSLAHVRARLGRWSRASLLAGAWLFIMACSGFFVLDAISPLPIAALGPGPAAARFTDREGQLLLRQVAPDEQWRMPIALTDMGPHLPRAIVAVEDERFHDHFGISPVAVGRAVLQNVSAGRVVSGASTLSMQACRMTLHPQRPRTILNKLLQAFRALQLERALSKDAILELYLNEAPFGGNLRGVHAAAQRYCGKHPRDLTLAEAALLVGVPQS
ncbi:MAG: transglycosylase domain-containing protein, partial [Planctomycetota bacterium]